MERGGSETDGCNLIKGAGAWTMGRCRSFPHGCVLGGAHGPGLRDPGEQRHLVEGVVQRDARADLPRVLGRDQAAAGQGAVDDVGAVLPGLRLLKAPKALGSRAPA